MTAQRFSSSLSKGGHRLGRLLPCLFMVGSAAVAAPITTNFNGTVTVVPTPLAGTFSLGDLVSGTVTYDPTLAPADSNPSPETGLYAGPGITDFTATIGSYQVNFGGSIYISVNDDITTQPFSDRIDFRANALGTPIGGLSPTHIQHGYQSNDPTRLSGDGIPTQAELANFLPLEGSGGPNHLGFFGAGGSSVLRWRVTAATTVPEPTALLLVAVPMAASTTRRRRTWTT